MKSQYKQIKTGRLNKLQDIEGEDMESLTDFIVEYCVIYFFF